MGGGWGIGAACGMWALVNQNGARRVAMLAKMPNSNMGCEPHKAYGVSRRKQKAAMMAKDL